jgi:hypothetical protein
MTRQSGSPPGAGDRLTSATRRQGGFEDDNENDSRGAADASPGPFGLASEATFQKKSAQLFWVFY